MRFSRWVMCWGSLVLLSLGGCAHTPVSLTLFELMGLNQQVDKLQLNPQLRYLRVRVDGRTTLMVMGYSETTPQGQLETWYSGEGEVLRLLNGRVASTVGLNTDWRAVRNTALPSWAALMAGQSVDFVRERDVMPGHRFGVSETVSLYRVAVPDRSNFVGVKSSDLQWFEEFVRDAKGSFAARYALRDVAGVPTVVYGEQCLSDNLCFSWQPWPVSF